MSKDKLLEQLKRFYEMLNKREIIIYCIDCKEYFELNEAKLTEDKIWVLCPICEGQNYTIRIKEVKKNEL